MKLSSLIAFLNGEKSPAQFSDEITPEVNACYASIANTRQGYIILTDDETALIEPPALPPMERSSGPIRGASERYGSIIDRRHAFISVADRPETLLTRAHARRLLQAMADQSLSLDAACYVADCIIMGHCFDHDEGDELPLEAIHFAADDSPPRHTNDDIQKVLSGLVSVRNSLWADPRAM